MKNTVDLTRPPRRWPVRAFNGLASRFSSLEARLALDPDELLRRAIQFARLEDFGDPRFLTPYQILVRDINEHAKLTSFGRFAWKGMIHTLLCNRLYIEATYQREADLCGHRIAPPIFIVGFPRTGSTFLHKLLACDPDARYLTLAEATRSQGDPRRRDAPDRLQRLNARLGITLLNYLAPGFENIHAEPIDGPAECGGLLLHSFSTVSFLPSLNVPDYARWLGTADFTPTVEYHLRQLRILDRRRRGGHWILKSPAHLPMLDALLTVHPDARVIFLHRDPLRVVSSFCSLVGLTQGIYSEAVNGSSIGSDTVRILDLILGRALKDRAKWKSFNFIDVQYADLTGDPVGTVCRIYDKLGKDVTGPMKANLHRLIAGTARGAHALHRYDLDQFGLDAEELRNRFAAYSREFEIPLESHARNG